MVMGKVGILYDNISGNTGDVAIGLSVKKILCDLGVEFDELFPGNFNPDDYETIIIGGGHIIRPSPHFFYDKFKIKGRHILNAAGVLGSPSDLEYLEDYSYITVRSSWDKEQLSSLKKEVEVVPCTTMLLEDVDNLPFIPERPSLGIHLTPNFFDEKDERQFVQWASGLPFTIYFLPITHYNRDYLYLRKLSSQVPNSVMVPLMDPLQIFTFIGKLDLFISCSLHGGIFSYVHNVPFVLYNYNEKMLYFMKDRGLGRHLFTNFSELKSSFQLLMADKPDYSLRVASDLRSLERHVLRLKELLPTGSARSIGLSDRLAQANTQITSLQSQVLSLEAQLNTYDKIYALTGELIQSSYKAKNIEQALSDRINAVAVDAQIRKAMKNANVANVSDLGSSESEMRIASLTEQVRTATERVSLLESEIQDMRSSIVWQMLMKYHTGVVDRALPSGTGRRYKYDSCLNLCRAWYSEGPEIFLSKVGMFLRRKSPLLSQRSNACFVNIDLFGYPSEKGVLHLSEPLSGRFDFPIDGLCEIKVLTATSGKRVSGMTLSLMESLLGTPIRTSKVGGDEVLDKGYTSFKFKPVSKSSNKTYFFTLKSDGASIPDVWHAGDVSIPGIQLYRSGLEIAGCIGFQALANLRFRDPYDVWIAQNETSLQGNGQVSALDADALAYRPKISIITPVWNTDERWLRLAIESVLNQAYDNWELCIADGGSTKQHVRAVVEEYASKDPRIRVRFLEKNEGIAGNSNQALSLASGEFVGFLDHDDELVPFSLLEVIKAINEDPDLDFIYSDEDKIDERGQRFAPFFKPDWSPDLFLSCNYPCHFTVIRKKILDEIGGFSQGYDGSQDYDLFLRSTERTLSRRVKHIPKILYHWRTISESAASSCSAKPYAYIAAKRALVDSMARRGVEIVGVADGFWTGSYRVRYAVKRDPKVSILIPNKNSPEVLRRCIDSIVKNTLYPNYEIVIIDNQSDDPELLKYYDDLTKSGMAALLHYDRPFNYSAINNFAASKTESDYILFLNNDVEVISSDWISAMLEHAQRDDVGAVGGKLLFTNRSIQHCGIVLGLGEHRVAGHPYYKYPDHNGYFGIINLVRNCSAVTGACLMTRRSCFEEAGGFDELNLSVAFNDVDYCLKLRERGYFVVYTPYAQLYHHESSSRGSDDSPGKKERFLSEVSYMRARWGGILDNDPFYSPNLSLIKEDFSIRL